MKTVDWSQTINTILEDDCISGRALAVELGVSDVFLGAVRKGAQPASPMLKFKLLDRSGSNFGAEDLILLLPEEVAFEVRQRLAQLNQSE